MNSEQNVIIDQLENFFYDKKVSYITIIENLYVPSISLLLGCIYQYYYMLYMNSMSESDDLPKLSYYIIVLSTIINFIILLIQSYKIIDLYNSIKYINIHIIILIGIITISGIFIMIIPPTYIYHDDPISSIYCSCANGKSELSYIPSEKYCCEYCNEGYSKYEDKETNQTICIENKLNLNNI